MVFNLSVLYCILELNLSHHNLNTTLSDSLWFSIYLYSTVFLNLTSAPLTLISLYPTHYGFQFMFSTEISIIFIFNQSMQVLKTVIKTLKLEKGISETYIFCSYLTSSKVGEIGCVHIYYCDV